MRSSGSAATTRALIADAGGDELGEHVGVARDHRVGVGRARSRRRARPGHERVLRDLAEPGAVLARWKRREGRHVGEHRDRLVERADEVLALGEVHRGLAADRGVDLREQRGGGLHDGDAAVVDRGRESGGVADHAAAERDDRVAAEQPPARELRAQLVDGRERLRLLAVADEEHVGLGTRAVQRRGERGGVEVGDARLADDRDLPAAADRARDLGERAVADDDVVGRVGERDGHPLHTMVAPARRIPLTARPRSSSITAAATSSTVRPSVSTDASCRVPRRRARARIAKPLEVVPRTRAPRSSGRSSPSPTASPSTVGAARSHTTSPVVRSRAAVLGIEHRSPAARDHERLRRRGTRRRPPRARARGTPLRRASRRSRRRVMPAQSPRRGRRCRRTAGRGARRSAVPPSSCPRP